MSDIDSVRKRFEATEREADPERKFVLLEEGLDELDVYMEDLPGGSAQLAFATKLRHSYLRRLLTQLGDLRDVDATTWFNYVKLLFFSVGQEVEEIVDEDEAARIGYKRFLRRYGDEVLAILGADASLKDQK